MRLNGKVLPEAAHETQHAVRRRFARESQVADTLLSIVTHTSHSCMFAKFEKVSE